MGEEWGHNELNQVPTVIFKHLLSKCFISRSAQVLLTFCQKLSSSPVCLFSTPHEQGVLLEATAANEGGQELSYQCWNDVREMARALWGGKGRTRRTQPLNLWFVTAPKGFCFRKAFLWPKLILSLPSAAQVWFNTSLEPGCAAGC